MIKLLSLIVIFAILSLGQGQTTEPPPSVKNLESAPTIAETVPEPESDEKAPAINPIQFQVNPMIASTGPNQFQPIRHVQSRMVNVQGIPQFVPNQIQRFIQMPPRNQPVFDAKLQCQQSGNELNSKRDISKRSLYLQNLESFYLNPKNRDIMFSVCGTLLPAHLIIIESVSNKFERLISGLREADSDNPIRIESLDNLIEGEKTVENEIATESDNSTITKTNCPDDNLVQAFKIFLKYFYYDSVAFDEIENLDVAFLVWKLGTTFLNNGTAKQQIEQRIANILTIESLSKVYRFTKQNDIGFLYRKLSEFIHSKTNILAQSDNLPMSCDEINGDIEFLDHFIEAMNLNQARAIFYIRNYINDCPQFANITVSGVNLFPHSLLFFRCTIDDLKELVDMGFISYEHLSEELENRLRSKERQCMEKQHQPPMMGAPVDRRTMPAGYGTGNHFENRHV